MLIRLKTIGKKQTDGDRDGASSRGADKDRHHFFHNRCPLLDNRESIAKITIAMPPWKDRPRFSRDQSRSSHNRTLIAIPSLFSQIPVTFFETVGRGSQCCWRSGNVTLKGWAERPHQECHDRHGG
jgi:hypothetical protein